MEEIIYPYLGKMLLLQLM